ncbi:hypothetical protein HCN44_004857 [Aphidius gifuensis]|uniref:Uncharacterized protein n=1 Tax=Aphidius gifuensis TaxID=684658 RepID=A0A834XU28_APHGI|nr:hypothetical protein HCN44_004857 [Aphidius gifuensis]
MTYNKNKQLSNAFFRSSRILETLASITQGRHGRAKIRFNNSNNINNCSVDSNTTTPQHQDCVSGDYAYNENHNEQIDENNNKNKNKETGSSEELLIDDGIKCFVYQDDNDDEERSFLIQAEESLQMNNKNGNIQIANNTTTTTTAVDENFINYGYDLDDYNCSILSSSAATI